MTRTYAKVTDKERAAAAEKAQGKREDEEIQTRLDATSASFIDGQIIVGSGNLESVIPTVAETAAWMAVHAAALKALGTTLPSEVTVTYEDGSTGVEKLYYPALVQSFLAAAGRLAARAVMGAGAASEVTK